MHLRFAIPGDLNLPTGGYGYDRQLIAGLRDIGWKVEHIRLPDGFPYPEADALGATETMFAAIPDESVVLVDGLAFGAMPGIAARHADRLNLIALVHHPLCDETGLTADQQEEHYTREKEALRYAKTVICTSRATSRRLQVAFDISPAKCVVAEPGTTPASCRAEQSDTPKILAVGSLIRRKGHDVLIEALALIADRKWSARIVGADTHDPKLTKALHKLIDQRGLGNRVELTGALPDIRPDLEASQIFALASHYEGYGMAFAEALAHGLPIVACNTGAVPDLVPVSAGALVPPDDPAAFSVALARLIDQPENWKTASNASRAAGQKLPNWQETTARVAATLEEYQYGV